LVTRERKLGSESTSTFQVMEKTKLYWEDQKDLTVEVQEEQRFNNNKKKQRS